MRQANTITGYSVRLDAWFRREGRDWLVWCPSIDVMTQARTKKKAYESLREAVQLWFESCIERGVLDIALRETGFEKVPAGVEVSPGTNFVCVQRRPIAKLGEPELQFSLGHQKGANYIEGVIPAHLAARQLGDATRAFR